MKQYDFQRLKVNVFATIEEMGIAAAGYVAECIGKAIENQGTARIILATGASQFTFLEALKKNPGIQWKKVVVFHLDEYLGISDKNPASFRKYLRDRILNHVQPQKVYFLNGDALDIDREIDEYERWLGESNIDIACIGIGENGHIAFNDPPVADFNDLHWVKKVELDVACRLQQLGEGWFASLKEVPTHALTLTVPAIIRSQAISCVVPDKRKIEAVRNTLYGPISETCPASILRTHENAVLWLDEKSAEAISH